MCQAAATGNKRERINNQLLTENARLAKRALGCSLGCRARAALDSLTREFGFSLKRGDLQILDASWYVTHTGLIGLARRNDARASTSMPSAPCVTPR